MNIKKINKIKNLTLTILIVTITSLMLISFLPLVSIGDGNNQVFYNYNTMKESYNDNIIVIEQKIDQIKTTIWSTIIAGLLILFASIIYVSQKYLAFANIIYLSGFSIFILSLSSFIMFILFGNYVSSNPNIHFAGSAGFLNYAYLLFISLFLSVVFTIMLVFYMVPISINYFKKTLKKEKNEKVTLTSLKSSIKKEKKAERDPLLSKQRNDSKTLKNSDTEELEEWDDKKEPDSKIKQVDKTYFEDEKININNKHEKFIQKEKNEKKEQKIERKQDMEVEEIKEKEKIEPKQDTKKEPKKDVALEMSFEQALNRAVEKKKKRKNTTFKKDVEEKPSPKEEKSSDNKKYRIRCKKCGHVFTAELGGKNPLIKCPNCSEEGDINK